MPRKPYSKNEIPIRADVYATGCVRTGGHATYERGALATGWRAGYRAALADVRKLMTEPEAITGCGHYSEKLDRIEQFIKPRR